MLAAPEPRARARARARLSSLGESVAGGAAGVAARCAVAPLDVLKIRFQLQATPRGGVAEYTGLLAAAARIAREEGPRALWRGNLVGLALWGAFAAAQFPVFAAARRAALRAGASADAATAAAGAAAGGAATAVTYPLDWARTALAARRAAPRGGADLAALARAARAGPFAGLGAALAAVVPGSAVAFGLRDAALRAAGGERAPAGAAAAAGAVAGAAAKLATFPLDTVKKRLQVAGLPLAAAPRAYAGVAGALRAIVRDEGAAALYKGLTPALAKAALSSALIFGAYDAASAALRAHGGADFVDAEDDGAGHN
jgi:solute carrier family 25 thiamine pyrophosphate transporter 19